MTTTNGTKDALRIAELEGELQLMAWLLAENQHRVLRLAASVAALLAQQMQPQVQDNIMQQLLHQ
jgi:hypothetical protein